MRSDTQVQNQRFGELLVNFKDADSSRDEITEGETSATEGGYGEEEEGAEANDGGDII